MATKTRNLPFDLMRLVCALCVIAIHCINTVPTALGSALKPSLSIAVPFFFLLSGFYYDSLSAEKRSSQLAKILRLLIGASLLYGCVRLASRLSSPEALSEYLTQLTAPDTWVNFFLWNESPFSGHLWYLHAFLYVLILTVLVEKKWDRRVLYPLIPVLLVFGLVLGRYSSVLLHTEFPKYLYRNYLFIGLPYFLLGDLLNRTGFQLSGKKLLAGCLVFLLTTYVEAAALGQWDMYFLSTPLLVTSLFVLIGGSRLPEHPAAAFAARLGKLCSEKIYILHPLFLEVLTRFVPQRLLEAPASATLTFAVLIPVTFLCSLAASMVLLKMQDLMKTVFKRKSS